MNVILIARGDDEVVEAVGPVAVGGREAAVADADGALGVVQAAGGEVCVDVAGDDTLFEFVGEMEGSRRKVVDDAVDHHVVSGVFCFGDEVAQLSHQVELDVGIVDADGAREPVVGVVAVEVDILVGIAFVVEVADDAFSLDVFER